MTPRVDRQGLRGLAERVRGARRRSHARGFTLIELMVAMLAGVLVAMAAFLLARNASTFFQNEARVTTAQFANVLGMGRLKTDLRRAGFLASPNVAEDPLLCGNSSAWPKGMSEFAALRIDAGGSKLAHPGDHGLSSVTG